MDGAPVALARGNVDSREEHRGKGRWKRPLEKAPRLMKRGPLQGTLGGRRPFDDSCHIGAPQKEHSLPAIYVWRRRWSRASRKSSGLESGAPILRLKPPLSLGIPGSPLVDASRRRFSGTAPCRAKRRRGGLASRKDAPFPPRTGVGQGPWPLYRRKRAPLERPREKRERPCVYRISFRRGRRPSLSAPFPRREVRRQKGSRIRGSRIREPRGSTAPWNQAGWFEARVGWRRLKPVPRKMAHKPLETLENGPLRPRLVSGPDAPGGRLKRPEERCLNGAQISNRPTSRRSHLISSTAQRAP
ncbi:hypothetical protein M885DRAFT_184974 [Pelagophyceae sp. CCMP2097]|nr:hypothetical protein M885DRAFT_184974 [Pelagophyceae sp. CCMP2097]